MIKFLFKKCTLMLLIAICVAAIWFSNQTLDVEAKSEPDSSSPTLADDDNKGCLECHDQPDWELTLANGDKLPLTFEPSAFEKSVHGGMLCVECHTGYETFPHPKIHAKTKREYSITFHDACKQCHSEQFNQVTDSIHDELFQAGNLDTPICVDCHQPHQQSYMSEMGDTPETGNYKWASQICINCHKDEFETYAMSVHGGGLLAGENSDLPTCIDCHNVHRIYNPIEAKFRKDSIDMCAKCHTAPNIMEKYQLTTNVLDTYVVFHDTTVTLLEDYNPDSLTNKPTCYDCHGIHNVGIMKPPQIVPDMPGSSSYPSVDEATATLPVENVSIASAMLGLLTGIVGTLTFKQLIKEKKEERSRDNGEQS